MRLSENWACAGLEVRAVKATPARRIVRMFHSL
jgi:hypothetical protein